MSQLDNIAQYLEKMQGEAYLQLKEGPLKESLLKAAAGEEGSLGSAALDVVVALRAPDQEPLVALRVKDEETERRFEVAASALRGEALEEIVDLLRLSEKDDESTEEGGEETFGMVAAANRLRVSTTWLKSVIPCTFYTYEEVDGRKKIKEYFWSRELIRVLHLLRSKKASPQEVQFIADHCCEGDVTWSREIIGRLKSYSRNEGQQKAQPQKAPQQKPQQQGKPAQNQSRPSRPRSEGERGRKPARSQQGEGSR